jgi:hypothetical protein
VASRYVYDLTVVASVHSCPIAVLLARPGASGGDIYGEMRRGRSLYPGKLMLYIVDK